MSGYPALLLRAEQKPLEHRSFSPAVIKSLIDAGYPVTVERSSTNPDFKRIFEDSEYEAAGAKLVESGVWPNAPKGTIVLGLKELPEENFPLKNDFIHFAHCYKGQKGHQEVLSRFPRGGSVLYDLEFLVDEVGRRVSGMEIYSFLSNIYSFSLQLLAIMQVSPALLLVSRLGPGSSLTPARSSPPSPHSPTAEATT